MTILGHLSEKGVTAYFTTHKHEIAEAVERGELPGACNLGAQVERRDGAIVTTYRMVRDAKEMSYGHLQAEAMGITPEALRRLLADEVERGLYPVEDTRLNGHAGPAGPYADSAADPSSDPRSTDSSLGDPLAPGHSGDECK